MTLAEWASLAKAVNADIAGMARAQQIRAEIQNEVDFRAAHPMEEQFIDADSFDQPPGQPKTVRIHGQELKIWKLHRVGLQAKDVKGADLLYEIQDKKFVIIQYKSETSTGRVELDETQLSELQQSCPNSCPPSTRFSCGSWFALQNTGGGAYFPACEAKRIFGTHKSRKATTFVNGLTKAQFQEDFGTCHIGARTKPIKFTAFQQMSLALSRVVFRVRQSRQSSPHTGA